MTDEELIKEIEQLPLDRQKQILDVINRHVLDDSELPEPPAILDENGHGSLAQSLYGILQFEMGAPTDAEVKDMIADYLMKKYY